MGGWNAVSFWCTSRHRSIPMRIIWTVQSFLPGLMIQNWYALGRCSRCCNEERQRLGPDTQCTNGRFPEVERVNNSSVSAALTRKSTNTFTRVRPGLRPGVDVRGRVGRRRRKQSIDHSWNASGSRTFTWLILNGHSTFNFKLSEHENSYFFDRRMRSHVGCCFRISKYTLNTMVTVFAFVNLTQSLWLNLTRTCMYHVKRGWDYPHGKDHFTLDSRYYTRASRELSPPLPPHQRARAFHVRYKTSTSPHLSLSLSPAITKTLILHPKHALKAQFPTVTCLRPQASSRHQERGIRGPVPFIPREWRRRRPIGRGRWSSHWLRLPSFLLLHLRLRPRLPVRVRVWLVSPATVVRLSSGSLRERVRSGTLTALTLEMLRLVLSSRNSALFHSCCSSRLGCDSMGCLFLTIWIVWKR